MLELIKLFGIGTDVRKGFNIFAAPIHGHVVKKCQLVIVLQLVPFVFRKNSLNLEIVLRNKTYEW
jgi:hypothetical protein